MLFASDWHLDTELSLADCAYRAPELFARRAFDLLTRGESTPALECAVAGTARFPGYATGWFVRARAELQLNLVDAARSSVEHCLALEPTFFAAWSLLESVHSRQGHEVAARAARQRLDELQGHSAAAPETAPVQPAARPAAPPKAPEGRHALVLVKPTGTFETPTLAEVYRRQGLLDRALDVYRRILERHPGVAGALAMVHKLEDELAARHHTVGAA
jgi:tetratricopeptide (TPR) repeat protein